MSPSGDMIQPQCKKDLQSKTMECCRSFQIHTVSMNALISTIRSL